MKKLTTIIESYKRARVYWQVTNLRGARLRLWIIADTANFAVCHRTANVLYRMLNW